MPIKVPPGPPTVFRCLLVEMHVVVSIFIFFRTRRRQSWPFLGRLLARDGKNEKNGPKEAIRCILYVVSKPK